MSLLFVNKFCNELPNFKLSETFLIILALNHVLRQLLCLKQIETGNNHKTLTYNKYDITPSTLFEIFGTFGQTVAQPQEIFWHNKHGSHSGDKLDTYLYQSKIHTYYIDIMFIYNYEFVIKKLQQHTFLYLPFPF